MITPLRICALGGCRPGQDRLCRAPERLEPITGPRVRGMPAERPEQLHGKAGTAPGSCTDAERLEAGGHGEGPGLPAERPEQIGRAPRQVMRGTPERLEAAAAEVRAVGLPAERPEQLHGKAGTAPGSCTDAERLEAAATARGRACLPNGRSRSGGAAPGHAGDAGVARGGGSRGPGRGLACRAAPPSTIQCGVKRGERCSPPLSLRRLKATASRGGKGEIGGGGGQAVATPAVLA